jgi:hypothetical protein
MAVRSLALLALLVASGELGGQRREGGAQLRTPRAAVGAKGPQSQPHTKGGA